MPFYEYECQGCGHHLEAMQKISDAPLKKCPECGKSRLQRLVSAPVFRLKGGGWYETDFKGDKDAKRNLADRPEPAAAAGESKPAEAAKVDGKADAGKAEGKPAAEKTTAATGASGERRAVRKPATSRPAAKKPARKPVAKARARR